MRLSPLFRWLVLFLSLGVPACIDHTVNKNGMLANIKMQNTELKLPKPLDAFVDAVNAGDTDKFLAFFDAKDGVINDWGRKFVGHQAIRGWSDKEFIGAKGRMMPTSFEQKDNTITLLSGWKSNFYSGDSKFVFILDGEKIREMRIVGD